MRAFAMRTAQVCLMGLALLLFVIPAFSQLNLGRLSGNVTDESGGTMAGAKVTVTDQERGVSRTLTTDDAGAFSAPSLTPGMYTVRVEANGFNSSERKDVQVQVGGDVRVDMVMKAGSQTQTITVSEELPLINTTAATLGAVMEGSEVSDLPFVGRSYQTLLQFQPGVVTRPGGGSNGHSSNGLRSDGNNWLFEGIYSGGVRTAGSIINTNSNTGDGASIIPPDAIQEMGVSFQNKAEYGWKPGVASNVGLKSGTNTFHGTAFAVGQTSKLNARNPYNPVPNPKPLLAYEQYGATAGGAIKKDKLFYYAAFEGMQFTQGVPTAKAVPSTALSRTSSGTLDNVNSIPAAYLSLVSKGKIPAGAIDANGKVINSALLTPQQQLSLQLVNAGVFESAVSPTNNGVFNYGLTATRDPNKNLVGKVDYHLNDKNQISGEYFWARDTELGNSDAITQAIWKTSYYLTGNVARGNWTYLPSSSWVNEFHFGYDRKVENSWPLECQDSGGSGSLNYNINTGAATPCLGYNTPTNFSIPLITINGFDNLGPNTTQQRRVEGYWSLVNNTSHTMGNHNLKFGIESRRSWFSGASYSGSRGAVSFGTSTTPAFTLGGTDATPLESFLMGVPSTASILVGDPTTLVKNYALGLFVQDDWRITSRITLNAGIRWEYETPIKAAGNGLATYDPTSPSGLAQVGSNGLDSPWKAHFFNAKMQPRLGVVWDVTGKGTTVIRGAYGIYSNWPVWNVFMSNANLISNPTAATFVRADGTSFAGSGTIANGTVNFTTTKGTVTGGNTTVNPVPGVNWTTAGPVFPTGQIKCGDGIGTHPGTCTAGYIDPNWTVPYVQEWTVGIQRAIGGSMSLDLAYVGNHGTNLIGATDANFATPGTSSKTRIQQSRPLYSQFPWIGKLNYLTNRDFSNYNALQATLNQRSWHGLTTTYGYTYGHALDITQTDITQNVNPNPACPQCDYGPTGFDVRHRLTVRATYQIPGKKGFAQMMEGWQVSSLVNLIGALPWNPQDGTSATNGTNLSGTSEGFDRWSLFGTPKDFSAYGRFQSIPCYGITNSSFAKAGCQTVAIPTGATTAAQKVANMPTACVTAASSLPTNPNVASSDPNATGLASLSNLGCYLVGNSVIVPPAQGTFGNMSRNMFRGGGLRLWDVSLRKHTRLTERLGAEFQFDMYNVTNSPQFATPTGTQASLISPSTFGTAGATPNVANGNVVGGTGEARRYQFGLKLNW